jgi:flagellar basal body-associated protein FliL
MTPDDKLRDFRLHMDAEHEQRRGRRTITIALIAMAVVALAAAVIVEGWG